jgi:cytoskeletal protein CcmA (bactofilin family)
MNYIKVITLSLSLVILSALAFVGVANAQNFKTGNTVTVAANETIDGMLFAGGSNIDIAGKVNGDVYCAGQTITISGTVNGDVICAGQTITISGIVDGSVRLAGQSIAIGGTIGNSATVGTQNLTIDSNGVIGRDLLGGSQSITINGRVKRDVVAGSNSLTVNGKINRNIKGGLETLTVGSAGLIDGNVEYTGANDPNVISGGKITGIVTRTAPKAQPKTTIYAPMAFTIGWFVYSFIAMIVLALVLVTLLPRTFQESSNSALKTPWRTVFVGFSAIVLTPVMIVMLLITAIGIPLAILITLIWIIVMILSGPFAGYMLGRLIMRDSKQPVWIILTGVSILAITYFIPIIGFITMFAAYIFGTGMILVQSKNIFTKQSISKK